MSDIEPDNVLNDHHEEENSDDEREQRRRQKQRPRDEDDDDDDQDEEDGDEGEDPGDTRAKKRRKVRKMDRDCSRTYIYVLNSCSNHHAVWTSVDTLIQLPTSTMMRRTTMKTRNTGKVVPFTPQFASDSYSNFDVDDFLEVGAPEEGDLEDINRRAAQHARLDRRQQELNDEDLARIAQDVTRRYRPTTQKYTGDMNEIPQRLLMPSVQDANLWQIRVRVSVVLLPLTERP